MPSIDLSYKWAVQQCNANNVGYSQTYRAQQTVNGIVYYDCSSFIYYALVAGAFPVTEVYGDYPFITTDMIQPMKDMGFEEVPLDGEWKPGDVGVSTTHTEMVYLGGNASGVCMGAHTANVPLPNQVSIGSSSGDSGYVSTASRWNTLLRYGDGASGEGSYQWIYGDNDEYFGDPTQPLCGNDSSALNNAACILQFFYAKGWSINAIAALCGNVQQESTFNPALVEIGGTGHGLVQWTPPEDLYNVMEAVYGHAEWAYGAWVDGDKQCGVIYAEFEQYTGLHDWGIEKQWYETTEYPIHWDEWATSTGDPGDLAMAFQYNYERPADIHAERADFARAWYDYLLTVDPTGRHPTDPVKHKNIIWMKPKRTIIIR